MLRAFFTLFQYCPSVHQLLYKLSPLLFSIIDKPKNVPGKLLEILHMFGYFEKGQKKSNAHVFLWSVVDI